MYYRLVNIDPGNINIEDDFWELNPQLKYYPVFKELYDGDKSKGKKNSSKTMWCVWMLSDPHPDNKTFHRTPDEKKEIINAYYPKFPWNKAPELDIAYSKYCVSRAKRDFIQTMETLTKRKEFLTNAEYHLEMPLMDPETATPIRDNRGNVVMMKETVTKLDTMHKNTLSISEKYEKAERIFTDELTDNSRILGGRDKTLRETGGLILDVADDDE